jgi:hypothetical protein
VAPAGAAGAVQFKDAGVNVGTPVAVAADGTASTTTGALAAGSHSFTAVFAPADPTAFGASTSAATTYLIGAVPGAPTGVSAVAGNGAATVSWTAPADNGGMPVIGYDVRYSSDSGASWTTVHFPNSTATTHQVTGLTNGVGYQFEVAAVNAIGAGVFSTPSAITTPVADPSALVAAKSVTIGYGKATAVSAKLTDTKTGAVVAGVSVQLLARTSTAKPFTLAKTLTTNASGIAALTVKPTVNTQYRWAFAGNAAHLAATSAIESVAVAQVVSLRATATRLRHGTTTKLYGVVSPNEAGQYVYLQQLVGRTWKTVLRARLVRQKLPNGTTTVGYVFAPTPRSAGRYTYRVSRPATSANAAGLSVALLLTVS